MREMIDSGSLKRSTLEKVRAHPRCSFNGLTRLEETAVRSHPGTLHRTAPHCAAQALVKVGSYESGEITLQQFTTLIDIIQGAVDESKLSYEYEEGEEEERGGKGFQSSKKTSVLGGDDDDEEGDGDGEGDEEVTDEEAAQLIFDELSRGTGTVALVDFLKWEDIQELLECGALSKVARSRPHYHCSLSPHKEN